MLIADGNGDLFGTTSTGGAYGDGTLFEIARTAAGYAGAPATLVSFNGANGNKRSGSLVADASGDLFGTRIFQNSLLGSDAFNSVSDHSGTG